MNPDFTTLIKIDYFFEKNQFVLFRAEDQDDGGKTELIGALEVKLGTVFTSPNCQFESDLFEGGKPQGKLFVRYKYLTDTDFNEAGQSPAPAGSP